MLGSLREEPGGRVSRAINEYISIIAFSNLDSSNRVLVAVLCETGVIMCVTLHVVSELQVKRVTYIT